MKIGLVRHFQVNAEEVEGLISPKEFNSWLDGYDVWSVNPVDVDLRGIDWNKCYASDLPRAKTTAETIYDGKIIETPLIREVPMRFTDMVQGKETMENWTVFSSMQWAIGSHKVVETIHDSRERINKFLDRLEDECDKDDNILVVCHGMIMTILDEQLKKRGFTGERVVVAENGELFLLEK